jgi:hypothetical protein
MIKFIHNLTGTEMWVADERKDEYLGAGHKLAPLPSAKPAEVTVEEKPEEVVKEEPKKAAPKRTTRAKKK